MVSDRERFLTELDENFSVQASAGTGKTTAIVGRVVNLARWGMECGRAAEVLGRVVVVTYTNRAADEMRDRLRQRVFGDGAMAVDAGVRRGMAEMFVGTIHSWCVRLIEEFGVRHGYRVPRDEQEGEGVEDETSFFEYARDFFVGYVDRYREVLRYFTADEVGRVARGLARLSVDWAEVKLKSGSGGAVEAVLGCREEEQEELANFLRGRGRERALFIYECWERFREAVRGGEGFCALPPEADQGGGAFRAWMNGKRRRVVDELMVLLMEAAGEEARWRQEWGFRTGRYGFSGQVVLAHRLLRFGDVREAVQGRGYRVILDEAQDTDWLQFQLLTEMVRPVGCGVYDWPKGGGVGPRAGHFCMVGDQQQAIYRERARLRDYLFFHEALIGGGCGVGLTFSETYRCREAVVEWVNERFSKVLDGRNGQAAYVPLVAVPREDGDGGRVEHWLIDGREDWCGGGEGEERGCDYRKVAWGMMARMRELGCEGLGVGGWEEVAILAPRLSWLEAVAEAARECGVPVVEGFGVENARRVEWRWLGAILALDQDGTDEFEVAAVLREVLGYTDEEIYRYKFPDDGSVRRLILSEEASEGRVGKALRALWRVRQVGRGMGLGAKVWWWSEALRMRERVMGLDRGAGEAWDDLLMRAWDHERRGGDARSWLREMRRELGMKGERSVSARGGGVELLTMQKAKGLEWEVVVVPFLWREIRDAVGEYPRAVVDWDG
ncbi:MAG: UvrD-helicase domain-containing protein, partial [Verrucomicrobiae bacterium]|nr:UvrD-helicase domain-containing protein [Verrucomicrobiae bacterium]